MASIGYLPRRWKNIGLHRLLLCSYIGDPALVIFHITGFFKLVQSFISFFIEFLHIETYPAEPGFKQQIFNFLTTP